MLITFKIKFILFTLFMTLAVSKVNADEVVYQKTDSIIFENYIKEFSDQRHLPDNELLLKTAEYFIGTPYVAATLESPKGEVLKINLRELDCMTLVESALALTRTIKSGDFTFANFCNLLREVRYREGKIEDYSSRLHYSADWMYENEKRGIFRNVSKNLGGALINKQINYMSTHVSSYPQLLENNDLQKKIKKMEDQLNNRGGYYVISKDKICNIANSLKNGDIVAFSTSVPGLDFSHLGIISTDTGKITFVHASSVQKKVVLEKKTLNGYCLSSKRCNGITILRLNDK